MDIIHLLEVLNPSGNVVTVKIDNAKTGLDSFSDFLVAIAPAIIAAVALFTSYYQFRRSITQQSEQFKETTLQQINELRLNVKLATEIELKKSNCATVRNACVKLLSYATEADANGFSFREYSKIKPEERSDRLLNEIDKVYESRIASLIAFRESSCMIETYLDRSQDLEFINSIDAISDFLYNEERDVSEFHAAKDKCLELCREYIRRQEQEIINISDVLNK
ncbi:TPA: hypothetical protein QH079_004366 [Enterobacter roggenkampii]|nr:hypothetical protein [Enterobacter roggenkampii]